MFPWNWWYSPNLYFPFSGDSIQRIAPETHWLFGAIKPEAGDGKVEREVFENVASYGKQLGLLTELVLGLADKKALEKRDAQQALEALAKLEAVSKQIEAVKMGEPAGFEQQVETWLVKLRTQDPQRFEQVSRTLGATLNRE